jgi:sterol desaturase/sphingolipid hydroxylase (fatty acid hydroxylase superfamily)
VEHLSSYLYSKTAGVVAAFIVLCLLERLFPARYWIGGLQRVMRNVGLAVFNFVASPLIVVPLAAWASTHALDWRPAVWSGSWGLVADLIVLDLWIYAWHRMNHVVPFLWRFHEVHHLDEMLDTSSALRFHFGEVILSSLFRAVVIYLLAMPLASVVVFEVLVLISALFHHSNLKLPSGFERLLSFVIVTPAIHWVHHHAKRSDTDSNYATVLSVWDLLFRSRSSFLRTLDMPIGVEGRKERSFLRLIFKPFSD